jgi:hypothetical protein
MICKRCGYEDPTTGILRKVERGGEQLCNSCTAKPVTRVRSEYGICRPWRGEVNGEMQPIDEKGNLVRAGVRKCGNSDCVAKSHIIDLEALELERLSNVYKDGKKRLPRTIKNLVAKEGKTNGRYRNSPASDLGTKQDDSGEQ